MLRLDSGRYPAGPGEVAVTDQVASEFGLTIGQLWRHRGIARHVVGIVENPQSLLDEFALVTPGQVTAPTAVTVLFDGSPSQLKSFRFPGGRANRANIHVPPTNSGGGFNPQIIVLTLATLGMLLIGLVAVAGFTVLAQRRLRSIGMLGALGATDNNIRLVVRANGPRGGCGGHAPRCRGGLRGLAGLPSPTSKPARTT